MINGVTDVAARLPSHRNQRGVGREIMGKEGEGSSQGTCMYKGLMDKDNSRGQRSECGRWGMGRAGESNGGNGDNCN